MFIIDRDRTFTHEGNVGKLTNWAKMRGKNTNSRVGEFYQHLVAQLLKCSVTKYGNTEYADVYNEDAGVRIEVKSRSNDNSFDIGINQKRAYEADAPFFLSNTLYALLSYRGKQRVNKNTPRPRGIKGNTFSPLGRLKSKSAQRRFLAEKVDEVYLLDLPIMNALEQHMGIGAKSPAGREGEQTFQASRTELRRLFIKQSHKQTCKELALSASKHTRSVVNVRLSYVVEEQEYVSNFRLIMMLPKILERRVLKLIGCHLVLAA